jgi:enoyl-CoA hydratase/carnithine racemase
MNRERTLFLVSAHNCLSQRAWIAPSDLGHDLGVVAVDSDAEMQPDVAEHQPGLIVRPSLKPMIPESIWSRHRSLIVHPGPVQDRGADSRTSSIVLLGSADYFSNGIHLNVIEAADDPTAQSWRNLVAINEVVREILQTDSHVLVSALAGDPVAGGVLPALIGDYVVAREDIVVNPFYKGMGDLYLSEYWTYVLLRRVGRQIAVGLTGAPFTPVGAGHATRIGLLDDVFGATLARVLISPGARRAACRRGGCVQRRPEEKRRRREPYEPAKPLEAYRRQGLTRPHECFFGPDCSDHKARRRLATSSPPRRRETTRRYARPTAATVRDPLNSPPTQGPARTVPREVLPRPGFGGRRGRGLASGHALLRAAGDRVTRARPAHRSACRPRRHRAEPAKAGLGNHSR